MGHVYVILYNTCYRISYYFYTVNVPSNQLVLLHVYSTFNFVIKNIMTQKKKRHVINMSFFILTGSYQVNQSIIIFILQKL